ncbi:Alpha/beta fold hydrolase [Azospirillaceae bacterium]
MARFGLSVKRTLVGAVLSAVLSIVMGLLSVSAHAVPISIEQQGSFSVGGRIVTESPSVEVRDVVPALGASTGKPVERSYYIDQMTVRYQIPTQPRSVPLVFVPGQGQTGLIWETTPDGREGFSTIFVKRGFSVYTVDPPHCGASGAPSFSGYFGKLGNRSIVDSVTFRFSNQEIFQFFRMGAHYPQLFANSQFPPNGIVSFLKTFIPTVAEDQTLLAEALSTLLDRIGPAVLITHGENNTAGWLTAMRNPRVLAVVAYEPVGREALPFPSGALPPTPLDQAPLGWGVETEAFQKLARVPVQIVVGDNVPNYFDTDPVLEHWRRQVEVDRIFIAALQQRGGNAVFVSLPEQGLYGNSHTPFLDSNNIEVANILSRFLADQKLDWRSAAVPP